MMRIARSLALPWIPALYLMSGCAQILGIEDLPALPDGSTEPRPDANAQRPDANPLTPDARAADASVLADARAGCESWAPRPTYFDPCDLPAPLGGLNLSMPGEYVYDTNMVTLRDPAGNVIVHASRELSGNPPVVAISVDSLLVVNTARLRVVGPKPLLVASWSEISVEGTIDVSSNLAQNGAGANTGNCMPAGAGFQGFDGGGGGGGGGLGGNGGAGGDGVNEFNGGDPGGTVTQPGTVRGGCPGARGGRGDQADGSGLGGAGGGALQLTARESIRITGRLHAGGSGGEGANGVEGRRSGGGGGGSGGLLDLEAPTITFGSSAVVAANGGGGGEGAERENAEPGLSGGIGNTRAEGGSAGSDEGGDGGDGSAGTERDGSDGSDGTQSGPDRGGGGGGGGSAGYIIVKGDDTVAAGAVLSPSLIKRP